MKKINRAVGLTLSFLLLISTILSALVIPLPIAKAAPAYSWATYTIAASGDDVELLAYTGWSNFTTDGDNLWVHSNEYTTYAWLRFEGLGAITNAGGVIDQIVLSMYSGEAVGEDYEEMYGGYVTVSCPMYRWNWELTLENILASDMNPVASFDGDRLEPSGAWLNWTIATIDPRDWYAWGSTFRDVFICYVGSFMQYSPDWTYYRSFTSFDEGHPAKLYVKYHIGEGYEEVLAEFGVESATYHHGWNNYNFWTINEVYGGYPLEPIEYVYSKGSVSVQYDDVIGSGPFTVNLTTEVSATGMNFQRCLTRIENGTLYTVFEDKLDGWIQIYVKRSHDNGTTWVDIARISNKAGMQVQDHMNPALASDSDGGLHVLWYGGVSTARQIYYTYYNGSWSVPIDISTNPCSGQQNNPIIAIDSNNYIHTAWSGRGTGHPTNSQVWYSNYTGSWTTPLRISTRTNMENDYQYGPTFAIDSEDHIHIAWYGEAEVPYHSYSQIWHREKTTSWGTIDLVSTRAGMTGDHQHDPSMCVDSDDIPYIVWTGEASGYGNDQIWESHYDGGWSSCARLSKEATMDGQNHNEPSIAADSSDDLHTIWTGRIIGDASDRVWYTNNSGGGWITPIFLNTGNCDQSVLRWSRWPWGYPAVNETFVATAPNGTVITPEPLEDPEDVQDAVEDWDEENGAVLAISIANIDAVEWVFEGKKRYEFTVEYINVNLTEIQQVGVGFRDSINEYHSVWYDRDANTLTVTSPEDAISGWLHSITQAGEVHTGINVTAVFHIMFNVPVPDSYSVSAYARIVDTSDSGWIDGSAWGGGVIFNIYNLGGLSTLTDSGMAGRVIGGDIFEIYAADTRTPILVPLEDFDVRQNPIAWWESGITEEELLDDVDWMLWMPIREPGLTMYPTNRLPSGAAQDERAYVSYPFGLRIRDNQTDLNRNMYMEKNFWREIEDTDDELVFTQFHMMSPDVGTPAVPGSGGEIRVMDRSIKEEGFAFMALQFRFDSVGNFTAYNSTAVAWVHALSVVDYQWYNVTGIFNLTTQMVDVYIDDVLKLDDLPFVDIPECDSLKTLWVGRANAAVLDNDFYVDDIGAWTDWDADYGGMSEATMLFKNLQHWSMDMDFFIENGQVHAQGASGSSVGRMSTAEDYSNHGYWEFGWDIMLNETWINDFLVARVNVSDGNIGIKNNWIAYNVTWYSQGEYVKEDLLYGLFEGYSIFPGGDKDTSGWHWDIWFNRANASTIIGARLNTEFFGMSDKSVWWAVWSSLWKPMRTEVSESTIFMDLVDAEDTIHSAKDVLFVRSWVKVLRTSQAEFSYKIVNIAGLDFLVARDTMSGVDTPPVRETKVPDVMSGFFGSALGSIFSAALKRLGNTLSGFGMGFFTMSVDFIDNIFAALGYPALVSTIFEWMDSLFSSVPILVGYGITMIGQIFNFVNVSAGNTLTQLTSIVTIWVSMYGSMMDMLNGALTPGLNLWRDLGITSFIQIAAILYPLWLLVYGVENGLQAVIDHVTGILNIGSFFLDFILNVAGFFMSLLTGLIGAIRG